VGVLSVQSDSANASVLKPADEFVSAAGTPITSDTALKTVLNAHKAGDKIPAVISRAGKRLTVTLTLMPPSKDSTPPTPRIGITLTQGCLFPFEVDLGLGGIGGPSAGLMFALGLVDKLSTDDLTHGKFIAGTGEIFPTGTVGPIGGIQLKMLGARRAGATVFLAPAANCTDVRGNVPAGLTVVRVASLHEAVASLQTMANGGAVAGC
jgi:PDZ domain-containing protein